MVRNYKRKSLRGSTYSKESLERAVNEIKASVLTYRMASRIYHIPETTLQDHVKGKRGVKSSSYGRHTDLSPDVEAHLARSLCCMEKWGFGLSRTEVLDLVEQYVKVNKIKTQFKNNRPGPDWFINFKKRNKLSIKKPQSVEMARKKSVDPFIIQKYFDLLKSTLDELGLHDKPAQIWNLDESSFSTDPSKTKVVGKIGVPATRTTSGPGRENTTVLLACSADGAKAPPLIVYKGKSIWNEWVGTEGLEYPGTSYAATKKGWMESEVFANYIRNTFIKNIGEERPLLLIYDGHSTHITIEIIEMALAEQIIILKLPPHSSHLLQPLDLAVFRSLKITWDAKLVAWQRRNPGAKIPKRQFSELIGQVWLDANVEIIKNGYKKGGIYPFNNNVIPDESYDPEALKRWRSSQVATPDVTNAANEGNIINDAENNKEENDLNEKNVVNDINNKKERNEEIPSTSKECQPALASEGFETATTFEKLLLSNMKRSTYEPKKKRKVCNGAEVITSKEVLQRLRDKDELTKTKRRTVVSASNSDANDDYPPSKLNHGTSSEKSKSKKKIKIKKKPILESDTSSDEYSSLSDISILSEEEFNAETFEDFLQNQEDLESVSTDFTNVKIDEWALIKFEGKKATKHYVAQVINICERDVTVKYARKSSFLTKNLTFIFPPIDDISDVSRDDIISILPKPRIGRRGEMSFDVSFTTYNIQ